jgi:hypothetical protein
MIHFVFRCAIVIGLSVVVFLGMQFLFGRLHCFDCGARYGFPLSYMQDGTYATHGRVLWMGLLGDFAVAVSVSTAALWAWHSKKVSK